MGKKVCCPKCKSLNFSVVGDGKKELSAGKGAAGAIAGTALLGPIGLLGAGAAMFGKKGKAKFVCHDCGNSWQQKL